MVSRLAIIALLCSVSSAKVRYDNFSLYKIVPKTEYELNVLKDLKADDKFDFWTEPRVIDQFVNVFVAPTEKDELETKLKSKNIDFTITLNDAQSAIENQTVKKYTRSNTKSMTWDAYYELEDIYQWIKDIATAYPAVVTSLTGGVSLEGKNIEGLKISYGTNPNKKIVFLECGIHAREWISPSSCLYVTTEILASTDNETRQYAEEFDWYIFPVTNPDGYVWTFESERLWRKNRKLFPDNVYGVDLNRNWDGHWMVAGASNITSSSTYAGPNAFSEPETRSLANFIEPIVENIDLYLSIHSYSQLLLIPYGHTTEPLENYHDTKEIGERAMRALAARYGTQYIVGNVAEAIYEASGSSIDWIKYHHKVPIVYCYELRDRGEFGFLLPTDQMLPNHLEFMDSIVAMIREAKNMGYMITVSEVVHGGANEIRLSLLASLIAIFVSYFV